jgi:hypothetical protein
VRVPHCIVAGFVFLAGCGSTPTPADVFRFEQQAGELAFRACTVELWWTEAQLIDECGRPAAEYTEADSDGRCLAYPTFAHSLGVDSQPADYFVVCLSRSGRGGSSFSTRPEPPSSSSPPVLYVNAVYGMRGDPP